MLDALASLLLYAYLAKNEREKNHKDKELLLSCGYSSFSSNALLASWLWLAPWLGFLSGLPIAIPWLNSYSFGGFGISPYSILATSFFALLLDGLVFLISARKNVIKDRL